MRIAALLVILLVAEVTLAQTRYDVSSLSEFKSALDDAVDGDSIVWKSGRYEDVFMDIKVAGLVVTAESYGSVIFTGASKVEIDADKVVLSGFQFVGGDIGTDDVIRNWGSDVLITRINILGYTSFKYLIVDEDSRRTTISYCNFENRITLADQNILSILVDNEPGYHKIQYCSFRNFRGSGGDMGVEPIRIGVSTQAHLDSRTIVEYCYFENCDGDGELISNKAAQNVFRYNTFENNSKGELVLRHGDEAIVYGNFFLNNMGGVRVREGQNHFIYNNYFSGLSSRAIYLQNESSDPLDSIHIYFNTIVDSEEVKLGGSGSYPPQHVVFANNIFANPRDVIFDDPSGDEVWLGNISSGTLGIDRPSGMSDLDPKLIENGEGFLQLSSESPAIDAAVSGFPPIPVIDGLEFDDLRLDIMQQTRPDEIDQKDVGASEFPHAVDVQPYATTSNTGPGYSNEEAIFSLASSIVGEGSVMWSPEKETYHLGEIITLTATPADGYQFSKWGGDLDGTDNPKMISITEDMNVIAEFALPVTPAPLGTGSTGVIEIFPNPASDHVRLALPTGSPSQLSIFIYDVEGKIRLSRKMRVVQDHLQVDVSILPTGVYFLTLQNAGNGEAVAEAAVLRLVKN
ncbi:MAG: chondroitinase-B domain-containing protein [Marinoscillum sp.]|uniref:chondroitinase-B domain-containing protein n=1 Tax=Marinoscillum sp. TaxID=2024838 RepID=UPI0032FC9801